MSDFDIQEMWIPGHTIMRFFLEKYNNGNAYALYYDKQGNAYKSMNIRNPNNEAIHVIVRFQLQWPKKDKIGNHREYSVYTCEVPLIEKIIEQNNNNINIIQERVVQVGAAQCLVNVDYKKKNNSDYRCWLYLQDPQHFDVNVEVIEKNGKSFEISYATPILTWNNITG